MSAEWIGLSLILIGALLLIGKWIRTSVPLLQRFFLPSSIIAGLLALLLGPEALGKFVLFFNSEGSSFSEGVFSKPILDVWSALPGLLISVIFACLFLGRKIPSLKKIWMIAGPQASFGQTIAWGQYTFGLLLAVLVLTPLFGISPMSGALIEIGFQGGHGTAAGLKETFEKVEFEEARDIALGLATIGVMSGVIIGVIIINWGVRTRKTQLLQHPNEISVDKLKGIVPVDERESAGMMSTRSESIEPLSLTIAFVGIAILFGYLLLQGLILLESLTWGRWTGSEFMTYIPLFPLAMIGGVILQLLMDRFDKYELIDRSMVNRIQGWALDFLIVSALATLSLTVIGDNFVPFLLLAFVGITWNVLAFVFLARRMIPSYWFERGVGDLGQSLGMTATGLLLMRIADSNNRTPAMESFGYKQLLFEPVVGGGLFTALSVPLIFQFGAYPILIMSTILMLGWMAVGILYFGRK